jgi:hypothetical protein
VSNRRPGRAHPRNARGSNGDLLGATDERYPLALRIEPGFGNLCPKDATPSPRGSGGIWRETPWPQPYEGLARDRPSRQTALRELVALAGLPLTRIASRNRREGTSAFVVRRCWGFGWRVRLQRWYDDTPPAGTIVYGRERVIYLGNGDSRSMTRPQLNPQLSHVAGVLIASAVLVPCTPTRRDSGRLGSPGVDFPIRGSWARRS